jgi:hypothetical protein
VSIVAEGIYIQDNSGKLPVVSSTETVSSVELHHQSCCTTGQIMWRLKKEIPER